MDQDPTVHLFDALLLLCPGREAPANQSLNSCPRTPKGDLFAVDSITQHNAGADKSGGARTRCCCVREGVL